MATARFARTAALRWAKLYGMKKPPKEIREYLAKIGQKGGKAKTPAKLKAIAKNSKGTRRCPKCGHGWRSNHHQTECKGE
jgi:hypothetical protein